VIYSISADIQRLVAEGNKDERLAHGKKRQRKANQKHISDGEQEFTPQLTLRGMMKTMERGVESSAHRLHHGAKEKTVYEDPGANKSEIAVLRHRIGRLALSRKPLGISDVAWKKLKHQQLAALSDKEKALMPLPTPLSLDFQDSRQDDAGSQSAKSVSYEDSPRSDKEKKKNRRILRTGRTREWNRLPTPLLDDDLPSPEASWSLEQTSLSPRPESSEATRSRTLSPSPLESKGFAGKQPGKRTVKKSPTFEDWDSTASPGPMTSPVPMASPREEDEWDDEELNLEDRTGLDEDVDDEGRPIIQVAGSNKVMALLSRCEVLQQLRGDSEANRAGATPGEESLPLLSPGEDLDVTSLASPLGGADDSSNVDALTARKAFELGVTSELGELGGSNMSMIDSF
jgi:hypothetical protein